MAIIDSNIAPFPVERETPVPSRFWWLKRIGAIVLITIIAGLILNWWWIREADRRYWALINDAHARGEPILPADFEAARITPPQNAAGFLTDAANGLIISQAIRELDLPSDGSRFTDAQIALLRSTVTTNAGSLQLARQVRSVQGVDWRIKLASPVLSGTFRHLRPQRELADELRWSAIYHHAIGEDREGIEALRDIFNQGHVLSRGPTTLIVHLVSIGLSAMACQCIDEIAPTMQIEGGPAGSPSTCLLYTSDAADE